MIFPSFVKTNENQDGALKSQQTNIEMVDSINNGTNLFSEMLESAISELIETVLTGDLNVNYLKQNDHKDIKDVIHLCGLKQVIKKPTQYTKLIKNLNRYYSYK